ncbi:MAG: hypothetical protein GDA36_00900 [Rhodobacteraceae bacterium]|nr:hypothetical protein [Paracoccaceae bacterium]
MADNPIIYATVNPDIEITPEVRMDAIVATGHRGYSNQVNNICHPAV